MMIQTGLLDWQIRLKQPDDGGNPLSLPLSAAASHRSRVSASVLLVVLTVLCGLSSCRAPVLVHVTDSTSACARLRTSYPSKHGLILFSDTSAKTKSIPWCFPGTSGIGVIGYNVNIPITHPGIFSLVLSDIRPATQFSVVSIDGTCAGDNTGKSYVRLGYGRQWSIPVAPGNYCLSLTKAENDAEDVWFTLTATRP